MLRIGGILLLASYLAGCGLKGPLYLPEKSSPVIITPASNADISNATSSSSSSSTSGSSTSVQ